MPENETTPGWSYKPAADPEQLENSVPADTLPPEDQTNQEPNVLQQSVSWTASEFVSNHKGANWHLSYFLFLAVFTVVVFVSTRDIISTATIAVAGILFIFIANRKPRQLTYEVNNKGVNIASKFYAYEQFKSFSLSDEEAVGCINFMPLHRFMPEISIFFPPDEGDKIIDILSEHLPNDQIQEKKIDSLFKKLRF